MENIFDNQAGRESRNSERHDDIMKVYNQQTNIQKQQIKLTKEQGFFNRYIALASILIALSGLYPILDRLIGALMIPSEKVESIVITIVSYLFGLIILGITIALIILLFRKKKKNVDEVVLMKKDNDNERGWFKRTFTAERFVKSAKFSFVIGFAICAGIFYNNALKSSNPALGVVSIFLALTLLLWIGGGKMVDLL